MHKGDIICHQLIDSIIRKGGQQISDRYIIKKCLNQNVSSQKNIISNELIKQSGIKSEYCTINHDLVNQPQPDSFHKDQWMSKSLRTVYKKKPIPKIVLPKNKCFSSSTIKNKTKTKLQQKSFVETRNTFLHSEQEEIQPKNLIQLSIQQVKASRKSSITIMRDNLIEQQKKRKEQISIKERQYIRKQEAAEMEKSKFKKQLISSSFHTYNEDGKYLIFTQSNHRKAIQKKFPIFLDPKVYKQEIIARKKQSIKKRTSFRNIKQFQKKQNKEQSKQPRCQETLYENNNKRQTSSVQYVKLKEGICFTEPSTGKSATEESSRTMSVSSGKQKQTFHKFFTSFPTENIEIQANMKKNIIMKSKTEVCGKQSELNKHYVFATTRSKAIGNHGKIRDINENLLRKLIVNF